MIIWDSIKNYLVTEKIKAALEIMIMPKPSEYKIVQERILKYAHDLGWDLVTRGEADSRRGLDPENKKSGSLYFEDLLYKKVKEFNPNYSETDGALISRFTLLHADIYGNRDFYKYLRNEGTYFDKEENREPNLILIDYDNPKNNVYQVTEEYYFNNGHYGNREDIVFLINGIPVLAVECKNATKDEAIDLGIDQLRRYHNETPEMFVPQQIVTATEAIGFSYGVSWSLSKRFIFNWKHEEKGNLEAKVKSFFAIDRILKFIKDYVIFAEKDDELTKMILMQHQVTAVERIVERAKDSVKKRGLIWHTQGSGKTYTMIKSAELIFKSDDLDKPTVLIMLDRNELEEQMIKNLLALNIKNIEPATSIARLNELLRSDYRGIIVVMIHKFREMPANINTRPNIFVLIDEAHRTTGSELGSFLMAGLPNATYIGFTGTPIDKTAYGKGTFKVFGIDDAKGYLHKYSITESIQDGTTKPLYYSLAPNDMRVPLEILDKEFFSLAETEGISDIDELNKILERAINLKQFLKAKPRIDRIAKFVGTHFKEKVESLGYKAFIVAVDREACALYKEALDKYLPPEYSEVVFTGNNNDSILLKKYHHDSKKEKEIRKIFQKFDTMPKILIVTEKLLTGFDAPILYALYLDKPMRDHTLLQTMARVNRPYENEAEEMKKPHGFVLDFIGIFENLTKALAFDSDEVDSIVKDIELLKLLFKEKMQSKIATYLQLVHESSGKEFNDKTVDFLIDHFRDKERRKEFFKIYKETEMLYEIISPDAFLRPYIADYQSISGIYKIVSNAYVKRVNADREFQKKTNKLVAENIGAYNISEINNAVMINAKTIELIKEQKGNDNIKVINLIKSITKNAEENSEDPFLVAMADRAKIVKEKYEERQLNTTEALEELIAEIERNNIIKEEQKEKNVDNLHFFIFKELEKMNIKAPLQNGYKIKTILDIHHDWKTSDKSMREARNDITLHLCKNIKDFARVAEIVNHLFSMLDDKRIEK